MGRRLSLLLALLAAAVFLAGQAQRACAADTVGLYGFHVGESLDEAIANAREKGYTDVSILTTRRPAIEAMLRRLQEKYPDCKIGIKMYRDANAHLSGHPTYYLFHGLVPSAAITRDMLEAAERVSSLKVAQEDLKYYSLTASLSCKGKPPIGLQVCVKGDAQAGATVAGINVSSGWQVYDTAMKVMDERFGEPRILKIDNYGACRLWEKNGTFAASFVSRDRSNPPGAIQYYDPALMNAFYRYYFELAQDAAQKRRAKAVEGM